MSEIKFLNNELEQESQNESHPIEKPVAEKVEESSLKEGPIQSKDFSDFRLIHTSRYGNSRVFTARSNGKKVVVKALKAELAHEATCRASLRQEFETTSMLDNKYIRKALDFVNIQGLGECAVFEFIDGKTLAEHVRVGTLSEKQVKSILVEICEALQYLHRNGLVHGNLNPENVLIINGDNRVKLIDIGVPETKQDADRELLIKEMEFAAPEIIKGEDFDSRADVYSIGKIMEFIGERNITKQFNGVATHCTQFSKEQRYDSISDVKSAVSKGRSLVKIILFFIVAAVVAALAFIYIPKIKANIEKERAERLEVDFSHEIEKMQAESPKLIEKYHLTSLSDPIAADWSDDSLKMAESLMRFLTMDGYRNKALRILHDQSVALAESRQADFDHLLLNEFKTTNDSIAVVMRSALVEPNDALLLNEARKWFEGRK